MGSVRTWVTVIGVTLLAAMILFITGNLVITTKPEASDTSSGGSSAKGKIVYELTPEEDAAVRSAE